MKFANQKNDLAFKEIFVDTNHKNLLISFVNSILSFKDTKTLIDVSLANSYQVVKILKLKLLSF